MDSCILKYSHLVGCLLQSDDDESVEDAEYMRRKKEEEADYTSSVNDQDDSKGAAGGSAKGLLGQQGKKRREKMEEEEFVDDETEQDLASGQTNARVVWSVELHQQFVNAVNQLGIDSESGRKKLVWFTLSLICE